MRLFFIDDVLCTRMTVVGPTNKSYDRILVDTGAFKSGLPVEDCKELRLIFAGTHTTAGLYGEDVLPMFYCQLDFGEHDLRMLPILGLPIDEPLIGRDILSNYRYMIDWPGRMASAERIQ